MTHAWQQTELVQNFLNTIRGALPLASEQLDVMLYVIRQSQKEGVRRVLDLGCGDGLLGRLVMNQYPDAHGVFIDFSEPMLEAARQKLDPAKSTSFMYDLNDPTWRDHIPADMLPLDVVVSGYAIHHLTDERKQSLYREVYEVLKPGGVFVNVEHVASADEWVERLFNESFIDGLVAMRERQGDPIDREETARKIYSDDADDGDICASVEDQCAWLRDIGFTHVDCYMKIYALAVFGGVRP
jgi:tRNA (cmo5U34)-methyltransferase